MGNDDMATFSLNYAYKTVLNQADYLFQNNDYHLEYRQQEILQIIYNITKKGIEKHAIGGVCSVNTWCFI